MHGASNSDIELLRDGYERWRRTREAPLDLIDPEVEWIIYGSPAGDQRYEGHAGVRDWFQTQEEAFSEFWWDVEALDEAPDGRILALIVAHAIGRGSGVSVTLPLANVWTLRDGKAIRVEMFLDRDEALRHAGLAPGD